MDERQKLADFRLGVLSLADKMNLSNLDTLIALSEVSNIVLELLKVEGMEDEEEGADEGVCERQFTEHLTLKWGNILSWEVYNPETVKLLRQWRDMREKSVGSSRLTNERELANEEKELIYYPS